jgi:hypothetical protein
MKQFIARTFDGLVTMAAFVALCFHIFLLGYENYRDLLDSKGICDAIVFFKMRRLMEIVENRLNGGWFRRRVPLSEMEEQTGRNLP